MKNPYIRQIRLNSPWAWLVAIPLLVLAFVIALVVFVVALISAAVAALFGRKEPAPPPPRQQAGGGRIIDAEYVIDSDPGKD